MQQFQVNVDVCPANSQLADQKHFEHHLFALGPSYNHDREGIDEANFQLEFQGVPGL